MGYTHNTYRLFSETEGIRLEMTFAVHLTGPYRLFAPFARGFIVRKPSRAWDRYVRAMASGRLFETGIPRCRDVPQACGFAGVGPRHVDAVRIAFRPGQ